MFGQGIEDIAFVGEEGAEEGFGQFRHRLPIIGIARGKGDLEQRAAVIDDEMELEAKEPAHRGFPAGSEVPKDFVLGDAAVMADGERGRVDEGRAGTGAIALAQVGTQRP